MNLTNASVQNSHRMAPTSVGLMRKSRDTLESQYIDGGPSGIYLTLRESQALRYLSFGLSNREIGLSMRIMVETVKDHIQNVLRKLRLHDRTQAAVWSVRNGIAG